MPDISSRRFIPRTSKRLAMFAQAIPKQLADSIRAVRRNTVSIAEDVHEDDYLFRPTADSRSVAEILTHIAFFSITSSTKRST
jgi:hypothetical protein